jgi:hypothetical protein
MEFSDTSEMPAELRSYWKFFDTDSAWKSVTFKATLDSAIYEWHIGSGIYSSQSFTLDFSAAPHPSTIPITLVVKKPHNQKCFPNGKDADTLVRNLTITYGSQNHFFGTYQGVFTDSSSSPFSFSIINKPDITGYPQYYIVNFFSSNDSSYISMTSSTNIIEIEQRCIYINSGRYTSIIVNVDDNGNANLTFDFYQQAMSTHRIRIFKGQRL